MNRAEELALQADLLTDRRLESDAYEWSVDADVQLRWDAAELRRLSAVEAELTAQLAEQRQAAKTWENEAERRSDRYTNCAAELIALKKAISEAEPVMIYHGNCVIDCGEHGHQNVEMLKMISAGSPLYTLKGIKP